MSLCLAFIAPSNINAALISRSLVDRPDDFAGYQIHLVHVAVKDSIDSKWDVEVKISS